MILCLKGNKIKIKKRPFKGFKKPSPSPEQKSTRPEMKCYKCGKPGHISFNCSGKGRGTPSQGVPVMAGFVKKHQFQTRDYNSQPG